VSARYWVAVSDELMASDPQWPDGLRVVEPNEYDDYMDQRPPRGTEWWLFEDDGAPASLEGKQVELTFVRSGGGVMIGSRSPAI
jgi:hypothetical protein